MAELHSTAGLTPPIGRSRAGPTPSQEIHLLTSLQGQGVDVCALLDRIAATRAAASVASATSDAYASHVRMIQWACDILQLRALPAQLSTISRVAAVVNNHNTLRAWLAAWRDWHIRARLPWAGDGDPYLRMIRRGTERLAPPEVPKGRVRFLLWRRLLKLAATKGLIEFGTLCNLAYVFAARVPSELLRQCTWGKLSISSGALLWQGVCRKGKPRPSDLRRWCVCAKDPLLCWHAWLEALWEQRQQQDLHGGRLFTMSPAVVTAKLQELVAETGISETEARTYTTHAFRRGAGVDVLQAEAVPCHLLGGPSWKSEANYGLTGMMRMGEWASQHSTLNYATLDEQQGSAMGFHILEQSDDEYL